jgi:hypothetical protein
MKRLIEFLYIASAICTPTSVILWIFASDLDIHRQVSVNLLLISLCTGFTGAVLNTIYDIIYGED